MGSVTVSQLQVECDSGDGSEMHVTGPYRKDSTLACVSVFNAEFFVTQCDLTRDDAIGLRDHLTRIIEAQ